MTIKNQNDFLQSEENKNLYRLCLSPHRKSNDNNKNKKKQKGKKKTDIILEMFGTMSRFDSVTVRLCNCTHIHKHASKWSTCSFALTLISTFSVMV